MPGTKKADDAMNTVDQTDAGAAPVAEEVTAADAERAPAQDGSEGPEPEEVAGAAVAFGERVRDITQHIVDLMDLDLKAVLASADRHQVTVDLEGEDTGIVIGKHGQTLEALQHLVGLIAGKGERQRRRVVVDAEQYQQRRRERRERELIEMARADAQRARDLGQEALIQYAVGAYERRIVHLAFKDDPDFITYSEGDEPNRYVVISPRD
ncbi:MAG: KH domain-containing protein [Armatimonadetes bacterium]|nr:KH domain-containing protein [Armatimonadota bacterium]